MKNTFSENASSEIPRYEKISKLLEPEDLKIVEQAFKDLADKSETDKRVFGQMLEDIPFVKKGNRHKHCLAMLEVANPSEEERTLQKQIRDNITSWEWERLERLQNEFNTLKKQNKLKKAIKTGQELLQQSIDLKGETHPDSVSITREISTLQQAITAQKQLQTREP